MAIRIKKIYEDQITTVSVHNSENSNDKDPRKQKKCNGNICITERDK